MRDKTKVITIAALVIAVIALSIGFAAFASTLNIQTGATVTPNDTFSVKFASSVTGTNGEFTQFSVTPDVAVTSTSDNGAIAGTPSIDNSNVKNPSIGNLSASFTRPGQSVTYTFYVVNDGNYDAYLTNLVFNNAQEASSFRDCVSDSLSSNPATQSLVDNVCSNISFTMSVGSDSNITSSRTLTNHLLTRNHYETVIVTIAYTGESYADGAFKVNFGDIDLNYRTIDEVEEVPTPTPVTPDPGQQQVIDLTPTQEEINAFNEYEKDGQYTYFIARNTSEDSVVYADEDGHNYISVELESSGLILNLAFDSDGAAYLTEEWESEFKVGTWYQLGENGLEEYTGSDPISSLFTGNQIYSQSYFNKLAASFGN